MVLSQAMHAARDRNMAGVHTCALPICASRGGHVPSTTRVVVDLARPLNYEIVPGGNNNWILKLHPVSTDKDRKSTRLNSSHVSIQYAVVCSEITSASAPPSDGQSAPTVPKPSA